MTRFAFLWLFLGVVFVAGAMVGYVIDSDSAITINDVLALIGLGYIIALPFSAFLHMTRVRIIIKSEK